MSAPARNLTIFSLAMINVAAVLSLRNYPSMAVFGWSSLFWYAMGTLLFLVPVSLVGAELATGWPRAGGIFRWVQQAFGPRWGFLAVFCAWSQNLVWFPTVLAFLVTVMAAAIHPALTDNRELMILLMLAVLWGITLANFFGALASSWISACGAILGTLLPAALIVGLGAAWLGSGHHSAIPFSAAALVPEFSYGALPMVATVVLMFTGMEMAGYYAMEAKNPQRDYPRAIALAACIIFAASALPTLVIAGLVPGHTISLSGGIVQALQEVLATLDMQWLLRPMTLLLVVGTIALISTWVLGPARGMRAAARQGYMPPMFARSNSRNVPTGMLLIQAAIGSLFCLVFLYADSVDGAYRLLSALVTQIIIIMYCLLYAAAIRLRYTEPDTPRAYRIPGGMPGIWLACGTGLAALMFAFVINMLPADHVDMGVADGVYIAAVFVGTLLLAAVPPFVFYALRRPHWRTDDPESG